MKTRIYHGRDLIGRFTCDGKLYTKWQLMRYRAKKAAKNTMIVASIIVIAGWLFTAGVIMAQGTIQPEKVWAKEVIEVPIKEVPPVMRRIAKCESGDMHKKNGKVIIMVNNNGTSDIGRYQINTVHLPLAAELGLNLLDEKDNEAMAMYLYENQGTSPWKYSASCWQ